MLLIWQQSGTIKPFKLAFVVIYSPSCEGNKEFKLLQTYKPHDTVEVRTRQTNTGCSHGSTDWTLKSTANQRLQVFTQSSVLRVSEVSSDRTADWGPSCWFSGHKHLLSNLPSVRSSAPRRIAFMKTDHVNKIHISSSLCVSLSSLSC